jgi:DNA polymerase III gamma/tau subunit
MIENDDDEIRLNSNLPLSEQFRLLAKKWVALDAAASLLEETKSAQLSSMVAAVIGANPELAHNAAERTVKASKEWSDLVQAIVEARRKANLAKVAVEYIKMKDREQQSYEATKRAEMRL